MVPQRGAHGPVTEVRFVLAQPDYPLVDVSRRERCRFEFERVVPRGDGRFAEFFSVTGADPERVLALFDDRAGTDAALLRSTDGGDLFEFTVGPDCPVVSLARHGALPRSVVAEAGLERLVAEIPPTHDPSTVVAGFLDDHPEAEFAAKRQTTRLRSLSGGGTFTRAVLDRLTERQREVARAAYEAGYYEWPRERSGAEIAADLDITSATFSQHLVAAERKLLGVVFDEDP